MRKNLSIDKLLSNYLKEDAPESWLEFLKYSSPNLTTIKNVSEAFPEEDFDTTLFFKSSISKLLRESLSDEEKNALYTNADKCMRQYELKKKLVQKYRFQKSWKEASIIEIDDKAYEWFCIFLLSIYEHFKDIRFLNTCCKVFDKISCKEGLRKNICHKITETYVTK